MTTAAGSSAILQPAPDPALLGLLGVCPLLAAATTLLSGVTLGIATLIITCATSLIAATIGRRASATQRVPMLMIAMTALATAVEFAVQALFYELHLALGLFLPLVAINATILCRAEQFAAGNSVRAALVDAVKCGGGMAVMLAAVGALRELLGQGSLFAGADRLLGPGATALILRFSSDGGFGPAMAPAGAFFALALGIALRTALRRRRAPRP
jgi:electron transport complex protein RnfE